VDQVADRQADFQSDLNWVVDQPVILLAAQPAVDWEVDLVQGAAWDWDWA